MFSVHASSLLYEVRALRSRLIQTQMELLPAHTLRDLAWAVDLLDMMQAKVERTGEYIGHLENSDQALRDALRTATEECVGSQSQPRDRQHR